MFDMKVFCLSSTLSRPYKETLNHNIWIIENQTVLQCDLSGWMNFFSSYCPVAEHDSVSFWSASYSVNLYFRQYLCVNEVMVSVYK